MSIREDPKRRHWKKIWVDKVSNMFQNQKILLKGDELPHKISNCLTVILHTVEYYTNHNKDNHAL